MKCKHCGWDLRGKETCYNCGEIHFAPVIIAMPLAPKIGPAAYCSSVTSPARIMALKEAIKNSLPLIQQLRSQGISWDAIVAQLKDRGIEIYRSALHKYVEELTRKSEATIDSLSDRDREILSLKASMTQSQVANIIGVSRTTVGNVLQRYSHLSVVSNKKIDKRQDMC